MIYASRILNCVFKSRFQNTNSPYHFPSISSGHKGDDQVDKAAMLRVTGTKIWFVFNPHKCDRQVSNVWVFKL